MQFTPEHAHFKVLNAKAMNRNVSGHALTALNISTENRGKVILRFLGAGVFL